MIKLLVFYFSYLSLHASQPSKHSVPVTKLLHQKISLNISEALPLKQVLSVMCQQVGVDLYLDPGIKEHVTFYADQRPVIEIVDHLCNLTKLRYTTLKTGLKIEKDSPYLLNYNLQLLNLSRTTDQHISIATNVFSNESDIKGSFDNSSNSRIVAKGQTDLWQEVKANLETLLTSDPENPGTFTFNRQGGILTVRATAKQHHLVKDYLKNIHNSSANQVLIEAKVIEVILKEEFKAGINWQSLAGSLLYANAPLGKIAQQSQLTAPLSGQNGILSLGLQHGNFSSVMNALQEYGTCRTLSSPRLLVLNNHNAILKVAQNQVYFRLNYDKQYSLNVDRENVTVSSDIQTVPIGMVMSVQPAIDRTTGKITLHLRPTISRLSKSVSDPAVDIAYSASIGKPRSAPIPSLIPVIEVRELDSVLETESGKTVVMGGLIETRTAQQSTQVPILGDLPLVGTLFTATSQTDEVVELVILLKTTIIDR